MGGTHNTRGGGRGRRVSPCAWTAAIAFARREPSWATCGGSQRLFVDLAGANADDALDRVDEDLAVTHFARAGGFDDGGDGLVGLLRFHADLEQHLGDEPHVHLRAAVAL